MIGKYVSHFEIRERLGQGGMAVVYKAWDVRLKRHVALKVLHDESAQSDTRNWILHEAQAASKLEHPNIATVYDAFEDEGRTYLAMQLLEGGTLADKIQTQDISIVDAIRIALAMARGLEEAHRSGVQHRDVKPQNVMFTRHGDVKLTDFGLAKETESDSTLTQTGVVRGTAAYLPPELLRGGRWDAQGDVYCTGVVLYEMLTGRRPFAGEGHHQLFQAILHKDPPSISSLRPEVPRRVEEIAVRSLEKRPADRYSDASTLAKDLEEVLGLLEADSELPKRGRVVSRRTKRRRMRIAGAIVAVLAVATFLIGQRLRMQEAVATKAIAVLPLPSLVDSQGVNADTRLVARMLTSDLGESSHIRVLGSTALQRILTNHGLISASEYTADDLHGISRSANLSHIVTVSYHHGGSTLRADLELIDMSAGETIATASEEVIGRENLISLIDPLASKTRMALLSKEQLADEEDRPFGDLTSNSPQAVALFYQAQDFERQAASIRAVDLYDKALELDPDFYLARQFRAAHLMGNDSYLENIDTNRLSEYEQLLYHINQAWGAGDMERLAILGKRMLDLRPGDRIGLNSMYGSQFFLGQYDEAVETCETAIRSGYRSYYEHLFLNSGYVMSGLTTAEITERYLALLADDPSDAMMKFWLAITYLSANKDLEARGLLDSVFDVYPDNDTLMKVAADVYTWRDSGVKESDYEKALSYLGRMRELHLKHLGEDEAQDVNSETVDWLLSGVPFSFKLAEVYFRQNDMERAIEEYERSLELAPDHYNTYYRLGQAYERRRNAPQAIANHARFIGTTELNVYDMSARGREEGCAARKECHSISRPLAVADAEQSIERLRTGKPN